ncbi:MAG: glycoside hydrolase family 3 protein, partial [Alistipes sp.]|nr:glycoside hydrolase family 3 protein [Alistipes sp.]
MKKILLSIAVIALAASCCKVDYKDPTAPIEKRVESLLSQMTLEEKVGQMNQFCGVRHVEQRDKKAQADNQDAQGYYPGINADTLRKWTKEGRIGSYLHVLEADEANELQALAMQSRLGIPLILGIDAIHGNCLAPNNTSYPTSIGLASSFDPEMAYKIARQTALEMRAMNMHWTFNPNIDVARDARWGRSGETFGEDTYLVSQMGLALVKGYQGDMMGGDDVLACIKHCIADSQPINGANHAPSDISERTLHEIFLPPYEKAIREGMAGSLMMAHNEINGV